MATLIFTPWYNVHTAVNIGRYRLIPFDLSANNNLGGNLDAEAKAILASYLTQPFTTGQPRENKVLKATLILISNGNFSSDELEVLQYVISFSGICDREFTDSTRYLCSDNFKIVVQNYPVPISIPFDPSIVTSRKNGTVTNGFGANVFREVKPWHITNQSIPGNAQFRLIFNESVAQCIWGFYKGRGNKQSVWRKNIFPALFSFHQANTDGHSQQTDCVYSESAIERLFLGDGHSEQSLVDEVFAFFARKAVVFETVVSTNRNWQSVTYQSNGNTVSSGSIFEAWIRELVRLRNRYAHGGHEAQGNWVWSLWEHLFLSSFVFPLLLKLFISQFDQSTTFTISDDDFKKIRMFERILAEENYFQEDNQGNVTWNTLISDSRWLV